jgi:predicted RecA/RadA family phage recombinase
MKNYLHEGQTLTITAGGAVASGAVVVIGALVGIAAAAAASGEPLPVKVTGVFEVTKTDEQAWTLGQRVYWDAAEAEFTTVATGHLFAGVAAEAVANTEGLVTGKLRLNGTAPDAGSSFAQAGNVLATAIAIVDSTTGTPDVTDPATLAAVTNPDLSAWNGSTDPSAAQATAIGAAFTAVKNAIASLAAVVTQNTDDNAAILDALKAANIMAADPS